MAIVLKKNSGKQSYSEQLQTIKCLEIPPAQEEKDLHSESFKHWGKKLKKSLLDGKISPARGSVGLML